MHIKYKLLLSNLLILTVDTFLFIYTFPENYIIASLSLLIISGFIVSSIGVFFNKFSLIGLGPAHLILHIFLWIYVAWNLEYIVDSTDFGLWADNILFQFSGGLKIFSVAIVALAGYFHSLGFSSFNSRDYRTLSGWLFGVLMALVIPANVGILLYGVFYDLLVFIIMAGIFIPPIFLTFIAVIGKKYELMKAMRVYIGANGIFLLTGYYFWLFGDSGNDAWYLDLFGVVGGLLTFVFLETVQITILNALIDRLLYGGYGYS